MNYDAELWKRLLRFSVQNGDCIFYTGSTTRLGYGRYYGEYTHRLSWKIMHGDIPKGMCVCHRCDNRSCINPNHLFLGTQKENILDAISKGRFTQYCKKGESRFGEHSHKRTLTNDQVLIIRNENNKYRDLKKMFGVNPETVSRIRKRIIYKNI